MARIGDISSPVAGSLYGHLYAALKASGLPVNGTADFLRVEIVSVLEEQPQDKAGNLRSVNVTIEAMSAASQGEAVRLGEQAIAAIMDAETNVPGIASAYTFDIVGAFETSVEMKEDYIETQLQSYRLTHVIQFIINRE